MSDYTKEGHPSPLGPSVAVLPTNSNNNNAALSTPAPTTVSSSSLTTTATATTLATSAAQTAKTGTQLVFIHKLYNMLEDESLNHLIWWSEGSSSSSDSFMLIPNTDFSKLLSVYFKHSNIASFVRQLNMYGFHKVNDSTDSQAISQQQEQQTPVPTTTTTTTTTTTQQKLQVPSQTQKEEVISTWEFKHNSGFFRKGDLENLKNIKRRSSKNVTREINIKQIDRIQNYIPKTYDDDDFYDNNEIFLKLNELNHNFNTIKNDHFHLTKKYELALEDLTKTNQDLMTLLDLMKDLSNNNNNDLKILLNKVKTNIINRNSLRENDLSSLSSLYHHFNNNMNPTSVPPLVNSFSRVNSFDSTSRDSIFINKDIRYSSVSSSSKRHQSILYDPLTTDPFQSRSTPELLLPQPPMFSPVSPGQPPSLTTNNNSGLTPTNGGPNPHYFQEHHFPPQVEHHPVPPPFAPHLHLHLHLHHLLNTRDQQNNSTNTLDYNSLSSNSVPINKNGGHNNNNNNNNNNYTSSSSLQTQSQQLPPPSLNRTRENSIESSSLPLPLPHLHFQSQPSMAMTKLQPPFEHNENVLRRGRSDSVSDRVLFKRSKH